MEKYQRKSSNIFPHLDKNQPFGSEPKASMFLQRSREPLSSSVATDTRDPGNDLKVGTSTLKCWSVCRSIQDAEAVRSYPIHHPALGLAEQRSPCGGREYLRPRLRPREPRPGQLLLRGSW